MSDLFFVVVNWIAIALLGVAGGSVASILGYGSLTALAGAVGLLVGGTFVFGSVLASYTGVFRRRDRAETAANGSTLDLAGEAFCGRHFSAFSERARSLAHWAATN